MTLKLVKTLSDIDVFGKRVFVRADLDVPLREAQGTNGERLTTNAELEISTRLTNLKPTVEYLLEHGASQIIIAGHIDRPLPRLANGKPIIDPALSTRQLVPTLEKILGRQIVFNSQLIVHPLRQRSEASSSQTENAMNREPTTDNPLVLFENLRFWPGEEANDDEFARQLASLADIYVNEAFGNSHRSHASMDALPQLLPHAVGLNLQKEIDVLSELLKNPKRPFVAIVGGAKIETKVPVIENLSKVADFVLVGGELPHEILARQMKFADNVIVATLNKEGKDIDDDSIHQFIQQLEGVETVAWNGPMGLFEKGFEKGTLVVAKAIVDSGAYSMVGGGETTQFLASKSLLSKFSFVSSGGGAMLEFLSGKELPVLKALG